jgi:hypothetical protein
VIFTLKYLLRLKASQASLLLLLPAPPLLLLLPAYVKEEPEGTKEHRGEGSNQKIRVQKYALQGKACA